MIKARLLKSNHSLLSNVGDNIFILLQIRRDWWFVLTNGVSVTNSERIRSKNDSLISKKSVRINKGNLGLPKGSNSYGNRAIILPVENLNSIYGTSNVVRKGRIAALKDINVRKYTTDSGSNKSNNIFDKLKSLHERSIICAQRQIPVDRKLYNMLCDINLIKLAYENLKSKPGNLTPAINPETLDGISLEVLEKIIKELNNESFQFKPSRQKMILKPKGGMRKLLIAPPRDKLVQEMMRIILNAIFDPRFSSTSHGFRPNHSCHSALNMIHKT